MQPNDALHDQREAGIAEIRRWTAEVAAFRVELQQSRQELRQARADLARLHAIREAREAERVEQALQ
jgi:hypothetical protein